MWSRMLAAALIVAVLVSVGWYVRSSGETTRTTTTRSSPDGASVQLDAERTDTTDAVAPTVPFTVTLPPGYPTPSFITTEQEAIAFAKALLRDKGPWLEEYVTRTPRHFLLYWENGLVDGTPLPTLAPDEDPFAAEAIWVVGLRSETPISRERVDAVLGLNEVGMANPKPWSRFGGYEIYVAFDHVGNLYTVGLVDLPDETGTPRPKSGWDLEGIEALPTP